VTEIQNVTPVILAGGSGTRLWPLSRKSYPKQFVPLLGEQTLFRSVVHRLSGAGEGFAFARPVVLTNATFRFIVAEHANRYRHPDKDRNVLPQRSQRSQRTAAGVRHAAASGRDLW